MSRETDRMWRIAGRYSAVGIEMAVAVAMGALGGSWLDRKLGTGPWLLSLGLVVGTGAAVLAILRVVSDFRKQRD